LVNYQSCAKIHGQQNVKKKHKDGSQNFNLFALKPPDLAGSPTEF